MATNHLKGEVLSDKQLNELTVQVINILDGVNTTAAIRILQDALTLLNDITYVQSASVERTLPQRG